MGRINLMAMAGSPTTGSSLKAAMVFQRHVTGPLDGPFVALFQDCADEPDDGVLVREDADDLGPPFDLAVEPFEPIGGV